MATIELSINLKSINFKEVNKTLCKCDLCDDTIYSKQMQLDFIVITNKKLIILNSGNYYCESCALEMNKYFNKLYKTT